MAPVLKMGERMAKLEEKVDGLHEKLDTFIDSADKKYAPRWMLTIMSWLAGILAVIISGVAIVKLV